MARRRLGFWRRFVVCLVVPVMTVWTRHTWSGQEHLPVAGGVILVPNHVSHFDPLVVAHYVYGAGRWPRFLGKASLWRVPVMGRLLRKVQQIPVERGSVEAVKSLDVLIEALNQGGAVITESVFQWDGMGRLFIDGLRGYDPNRVMAFFVVTGVFAVVFNLLADIVYAVLDPRIRIGE